MLPRLQFNYKHPCQSLSMLEILQYASILRGHRVTTQQNMVPKQRSQSWYQFNKAEYKEIHSTNNAVKYLTCLTRNLASCDIDSVGER